MAESKSTIENLMDHFIEMVNAELVKCVESESNLREDNNILLEKLTQKMNSPNKPLSLVEKKVLEDEVRDAASSSQENYSLCEKLEICPAAEVDNHSEDDEKD
ncbi:hypothetical protein DAPPUDRAFT_324675 [Daphnia pulex]|uniref:Uncharacterized protein n=1 Tax=Daphnia pulex TaxID=6669 RepID=E9H2F0_DAPPU|nr:hypothetical protein DAPPUDRAFT_324675 [Daphnia pulex]|eukprot:EFX73968.1 hypothetical protein DAPPUDRAFT_324675 [Daphnia pulex]